MATARTIRLNEQDYNVENLSTQGKVVLESFEFTNRKLTELNNMQALLQRAKNSYVDSLKKEILSNKAGIILDD